jgi:tRNA(fMet)-specific endonuclease VapC
MKYLLDTNAASALIRGHNQAIRNNFNAIAPISIAISVISEAELRYGIAKNFTATRLQRLVFEFLDGIQILPWDSTEAVAYADMRAAMMQKGKVLSELDSLIAAHALASGCTLVTADKAFSMVPNLKTINWEI